MKKNRSIDWYYLIWILFCAIVIACLTLYNLRQVDIITVLNDEFGYWGCAAVIAGINWKPLLAQTPFYSFGYSFVLAPIMKLCHNTALMYQIAILLNAIFVLISFMLCVSICKKLIKQENRSYIYVVSFLAVMTIQNLYQIRSAWPEVYISLLMWISVLMMLRVEEDPKLQNLIALYAIYAVMIFAHRRTIPVVMIGIGLTSIQALKEKNRKNIIVLIAIICILAVVGVFVKKFEINSFFGASEASNLNNSSISETATYYFGSLLSTTGTFFRSLSGKIVAALLSTYMLGGVVIWELLKSLVKKGKISITRAYIVLSFFAMLVLSSFQIMGNSRKDFPVYTRYFDYTIGPVIVLGMMQLSKDSRAQIIGIFASGVLCCILGFEVVESIISGTDIFNVPCSPFLGGVYFFAHTKYPNHIKFLLIAFICAYTIAALLLILFIHKSSIKYKYLLLVICSVLLNSKVVRYSNNWLDNCRNGFRNEAVTIMDYLKEEDGDIYYVRTDEVGDYCVYAKWIQYLLYDKTVNVITTDEIPQLDNDSMVMCGTGYDIVTPEIGKALRYVSESGTIKLYKIVSE